MTRRTRIAGLLLGLLAGLVPVRAQQRDGAIFLDAIPFAGETGPRLDLYLAVPSSLLGFERDGEVFSASYRLRLEVHSGGRRLYDTSFERSIVTRSSDVAASRHTTFDFLQRRLEVASGTHEVRVELVDPRTSFATTARHSITIPDRTHRPFSLSGLLLVDRIREDADGFVITPMLTDDVGASADGYFLFFEAYNALDPFESRLIATYRSTAGDTVSAGVFDRTIASGRSQQWLRLDTPQLAPGAYTLEVAAARRSDSTAVLWRSERSVRIGGAEGVPTTEAELEERITQLRFVALPSEIDQIRAATTLAERRQRFAAYWRRLDPSPGTPENEAMREYFARIDYAREHFRSYAPGWTTDQGRVYVIYGPPDHIGRDPFRADGRRIETWQYYSRGNLTIVFEDDSGFGDYRLVTPISSLEKYRYGG